ncbi:NADH-quinone oxidoreductase subunit NuoG [Sulfuricella sp.]|uniref:NADH-quinone oxidoreductase subunit NuoG n=1 Tax=Sulfuricella sp. TaxID=2099377 RepID=UPI002C99FF56|nr:NADH-quinone oxidoreductase subunit NuoG [Sulfuricella sp.]HUX64744.1 NADH-quinone oxidoreductase subunit NuoG [Sulfuricella sp.]
MLNIEIDGKQLTVEPGSTIMDVADAAGIYIPRFCYHKKLSVAANCRMCLVQVEKAPKPMPACATPVTEGMKVMTRSETAIKAQKAVMEFLLINHPLDCPICDQGGECELQDLAVGYGASASRYAEEKRVVFNKNIGPLITTDMTRCINCTRCVRFGQEIGGMMEMGQIGRGEHAEITTFIERSINSELSGNIIDLCPVGALTSKPFRYSARAWELTTRPSVSPHDGLGANLSVQTRNNRVFRVLPRDNEEINECWLSDKDRFAYEGLNAEDRLQRPMIKRNGEWRECDWSEALEFVVAGVMRVRDEQGEDQVGALASPHATLEELYLLQKLLRGIGSGNVDHRLRQSDFSADAHMQGTPWLGMSIAELDQLNSVLIVGSTLRADHPLLAHRLRQAVKRGAELNLINPVDDDLLCRVANQAIVAPDAMAATLDQVRRALAGESADTAAQAIATSLKQGERKAVLLGNLAQHHPRYAELHALAQQIAELAGAKFGFLGEAANSVGAHLAGAMPSAGGMNAAQMIDDPRRAYILLGVEAELDSYNPTRTLAALQAAQLVVVLSAYKNKALDYAHVLLPVAPFTETSGSFVNTEGRVQSFNAVVKPLGETRPGWKVLRVLGNLMDVKGFDYDSAEQVRAEVLNGDITSKLNNSLQTFVAKPAEAKSGLQRIGEVPAYHADAIVRRAAALQKTAAAAPQGAWMNAETLASVGVAEGADVSVSQGAGSIVLKALRDDRLPAGCVRVAAGHPATAMLGGMLDEIVLGRVG